MTLQEFERRLKKIKPSLTVKQRGRGYGDVAGLFDGSKYIVRLTKGEFNLNGLRYRYFGDDMQWHYGDIEKRGRKSVVKMLEGKLKLTLDQRASLLWGM